MPLASLENLKLNYLQIHHQNNQLPLDQNQRWEDVIMIHGWATNLAFWYPIANKLIIKPQLSSSQGTRITLFDLPGHGRSSMISSGYSCTQIASQLKQLVDYLKLDRFHVVTHSFGGRVAIDFVAQFPTKVKSLTLADVRLNLFQPQQLLANWSHRQQIEQFLSQLNLQISANETEAGMQLLTKMAQWQVNQSDKSTTFNADMLGKVIPIFPNPQTAKKWLKLMETTNAQAEFRQPEAITKNQLAQLKIPTFLIYGSQSPNLKTKSELETILNPVNSYIVENAGHFFPLSQSELFIQQLTPFLQQQQI